MPRPLTDLDVRVRTVELALSNTLAAAADAAGVSTNTVARGRRDLAAEYEPPTKHTVLHAVAARMAQTAGVAMTGHDVRDLRRTFGLTGQQFADMLGVGRATVTNWERAGAAAVPHHGQAYCALACARLGVAWPWRTR